MQKDDKNYESEMITKPIEEVLEFLERAPLIVSSNKLKALNNDYENAILFLRLKQDNNKHIIVPSQNNRGHEQYVFTLIRFLCQKAKENQTLSLASNNKYTGK